MISKLSFINISICLSCFKLLFLKLYLSTDFDVHRNWMAITYHLPIQDWYFDETSEWTLDYPPLFAAFEFLLALIAHLFNLDDILRLSKQAIRTQDAIIFQRISVIVTDLVYYYSVYTFCRSIESLTCNVAHKIKKTHDLISRDLNLLETIFRPDKASSIALLLLIQPSLILVDHIHFQYNGLLSGIFLLSLSNIITGKYVQGSFWFSILLNMKHIYLYCASAFGMYLLTSYCLSKQAGTNRIISFIYRTVKLGLVVMMVFLTTYLPFADPNILKKIASRLFPFKRGLTHSYWAPNVWSLYNTIDKLLAKVLSRAPEVKFDMDSISKTKSSSSGLVQEYDHQFLPSITPPITFILVAIFTLPLVIKFVININRTSPSLFLKGVALASFTSFMFGWHVHEKAIILVLLPLIPIGIMNGNLRHVLSRLSLAGIYSLFPLLYEKGEYLTKLSMLLAYYCYLRSFTFDSPEVEHDARRREQTFKMRFCNLLDRYYLVGLVVIEAYTTLLYGKLDYNWNPLARLNRLDFLPLMLISNYSALGVTFSYLELYYDFLLGTELSTLGV